jgi:TRAP-type C4-dicarboxylate transport system substrate-binding protein
MRRTFKVLFCMAALSLGAPSARAQTVTVKLGTIAPDGSPWHALLKEMGEKWSAESGGKVKLKIFPGGIQGNEGDMVRKMRVGQLQASALSIIGMRDICSAPQALGAPGLITTDEELAYVYEKLAPTWEEAFAKKGFVVLIWGDTGWAYVFSAREGRTPKDLKGLKMFSWNGDPGAAEAWKEAGFTPVVISSTDIPSSLATGMIEAFATTPILAMTARWYEKAKFMPDARWGRLAGSTLITKETWEKIPADVRPKLLAIARSYEKRINTEVTRMGLDSISVMKKNGLKVLELTEAERAAWQQAAEKTWPIVRGKVVTAEEFDLVRNTRDEFRATRGK